MNTAYAGGGSALNLARMDARCKAAIDLDGAAGNAAGENGDYSMLVISRAGPDNSFVGEDFNPTRGETYYLHLPMTDHLSYSDAPYLNSSFVDRAGLRHREIIEAYVRSFFLKHVSGTDNGFLDLPAPPEAGVYRRVQFN